MINSTKRRKKTTFLFLFTGNEQCDQMKGTKSIYLEDPFHDLRHNLQIFLQNNQKTKNGLSPIRCITPISHKDKELPQIERKNQSGYVSIQAQNVKAMFFAPGCRC